MPKLIKFKSTPENWRKEWLGLKPNTTRVFDDESDPRKKMLDHFIKGNWNLIDIEIENTETFEVFTRKIKDVTKYNEMYIISWKE